MTKPGEQPTNLGNIARFLVANPRQAGVLVRKVFKRLKDGRGKLDQQANFAWIDAHSMEPAAIATKLDADLWREAEAYGENARKAAEPILKNVPFDMGAGGDYEMLYWLTRYLRPEVIVETGVSAGWTSRAFLTAIRANGHGTLYSSDFPYFRVKNPEDYIGILVEDSLKENWHPYIIGDALALPEIISKIGQIDLFHYDSDKSYSGREFGIRLALRHLSASGIVLVDDIRDNSWFTEFAADHASEVAVLNGRTGVIDPNDLLGLMKAA